MTTALINQIQLKELGLLQISGEQCFEFLQGQLTCDVREVTPTQSRLGLHCNAKGRVLATFRLFYVAPHYYLLLPRAMVNPLLRDLRKYTPFYRVTLQDASDSLQKIGLTSVDLGNDLGALSAFQLGKDAVYTDQTMTLLAIPGAMPRVIVLGSRPSFLDGIVTQTKPFSYWETIDVDSGIATVTPETRGLFTPHHLNYHKQGGISLTKGCYTGQEVIARMHYLGTLKQQLFRLTFNSDTLPSLGEDIVDNTGKPQGTLVMATLQLDDLRQSTYSALAVIQNTAIVETLYLGDIPIQRIVQTDAES